MFTWICRCVHLFLYIYVYTYIYINALRGRLRTSLGYGQHVPLQQHPPLALQPAADQDGAMASLHVRLNRPLLNIHLRCDEDAAQKLVFERLHLNRPETRDRRNGVCPATASCATGWLSL